MFGLALCPAQRADAMWMELQVYAHVASSHAAMLLDSLAVCSVQSAQPDITAEACPPLELSWAAFASGDDGLTDCRSAVLPGNVSHLQCTEQDTGEVSWGEGWFGTLRSWREGSQPDRS